jgi:predicted Rossmann fold flavoprotein
MEDSKVIIIAGGGASGFFSALACKEAFPQHRVVILEKTRQLLSKVRISGGGRCNVTHACFDPTLLVQSYPRGRQELRGPFSRFQPLDTIRWFTQRGIELHAEEDGRMFPTTNLSETIINCFLKEAARLGIEIQLENGIEQIERNQDGFILQVSNHGEMRCDRLLMATGSTPRIFSLLEKLDHAIHPLVPSLFTFNLPDSPFLDLAGLSVPVAMATLPALGIEQKGPLLCTHWGFSGPAILKLSAWAARELDQCDYKTSLRINWLPELSEGECREEISQVKQRHSGKQIGGEGLFQLPRQLWKRLLTLAEIDEQRKWSTLTLKELSILISQLRSTQLNIQGKTTYKQEFVTCGGVSLKQVNFKTMESRQCPGLYFAGEILNIDGITGGYNFQNAWTTGWIAGNSIGAF